MYFFYPFYIKKEDAKDVINWQRKIIALVLIAMGAVIWVMRMFVYPKLSLLYIDLNTNLPVLTQSFPTLSLVIMIGIFIIALYLLFSKPDYSKANMIVKKYKSGEMIKTKELIDNKVQFLVIGVVILLVIYLFTSLISPIYSLTNQY